MVLVELAVLHGTASVHVPGHLAMRQKEWRKGRPTPQTGKANAAGWYKLASIFEKGGIPVQHAGERLLTA